MDAEDAHSTEVCLNLLTNMMPFHAVLFFEFDGLDQVIMGLEGHHASVLLASLQLLEKLTREGKKHLIRVFFVT